MPAYFPIAVDLERRLCVIVGGGTVAARRANSVHECGARVRIIAPYVCDEIKNSDYEIRVKPFEAVDLEGAFLVIATTDDTNANTAVVAEASARRILCNDAETSEHGDFIIPSTVRRGELVFSVTTGVRLMTQRVCSHHSVTRSCFVKQRPHSST